MAKTILEKPKEQKNEEEEIAPIFVKAFDNMDELSVYFRWAYESDYLFEVVDSIFVKNKWQVLVLFCCTQYSEDADLRKILYRRHLKRHYSNLSKDKKKMPGLRMYD